MKGIIWLRGFYTLSLEVYMKRILINYYAEIRMLDALYEEKRITYSEYVKIRDCIDESFGIKPKHIS